MDVTPWSLKSNIGKWVKPASFINGIRNPPKQASTCNGILWLRAILESSPMGSIAPCGYDGAEPTILNPKLVFEKK